MECTPEDDKMTWKALKEATTKKSLKGSCLFVWGRIEVKAGRKWVQFKASTRIEVQLCTTLEKCLVATFCYFFLLFWVIDKGKMNAIGHSEYWDNFNKKAMMIMAAD